MSGIIEISYCPPSPPPFIAHLNPEQPTLIEKICRCIQPIFEWIQKQLKHHFGIPKIWKGAVNKTTKIAKDTFSSPVLARQYKLIKSCMPAGIEMTRMLKYALKNLIHRQTQGAILPVIFDHKSSDPLLRDHIRRFHSFGVFQRSNHEKHPLNDHQLEMGRLLAANHSMYQQLVDKALVPNATRHHWTREDMKLFDSINLMLIREDFESLTELFNSDYLNATHDLLKERFKVDYKESIIAQRLSFALAYNTYLEGKIVPLPVKQADGIYRLCNYRMEMRKVGNHLPYVILTPVDDMPEASPWMVFRGTTRDTRKDEEGEIRPGAFESCEADIIDPDSVANGLITEALLKTYEHSCLTEEGTIKYNLAKELKTAFKNGKPYKLAGHSLGGFLAKDVVRHLPRYVEKVYAFNAPWMCLAQGKDWKAKVKSGTASNEQIVQWIMEGDLVPGVGKRGIGICLAVKPEGHPFYPVVGERHDPIFLHQQHLLSRGNFTVREVDVKKERKKRIRLVGDSVRAWTGAVYRWRSKKDHLPSWWRNQADNIRRFNEIAHKNNWHRP